MQGLISIPKICGPTIAGVRAIVLFESSNLSSVPPPGSLGTVLSYIDPTKVYGIVFERYSGRFTEKTKQADGGDVYDYDLTCFVPNRRTEMETLIGRVRNRRVNAIYVSRGGFQGLVWNGRFSAEYDSGDKPGSRQGYKVSISGTHLRQLPVIEGSATLPDPCSGTGGGGGTECCVIINPNPLDYTPDPTGNAENHNEVVIGQDGNIYLIDSVGNSIVLGGLPPKFKRWLLPPDGTLQYVLVPPWIPLPDPDDFPPPGFNAFAEVSKRQRVKRNRDWLTYGVDYQNVFTAGEQRIYFNPWLHGDDILELYVWQYPKHSPILPNIDLDN